MTSEGLGEMFEGDSADKCGGKFPLMSMGGRAEGPVCADPGERTPIGVSGNLDIFCSFSQTGLSTPTGVHNVASGPNSCICGTSTHVSLVLGSFQPQYRQLTRC